MYLANKILNFAHMPEPKRQKLESKVHADFGRATNGHGPSFLGNDRKFTSQGLDEIASALPGAFRLLLNKDVMDAVEKIEKKNNEKLLAAFKFARLPYPVTWIEWPRKGNEEKEAIGWLLKESGEDDEREIRFIQCMSSERLADGLYPLAASGLEVAVNKDGFRYTRDVHPSLNSIDSHKDYTVLALLLLLNSRTPIVRIDDALHTDRDAIKRRHLGRLSFKDSFLSIQQVDFDIARVLQKGASITEDEARELRYMTIRAGHFKLRETGVFWWSPHSFRVTATATTKADPTTPKNVPFVMKERVIVDSKPDCAKRLPNNQPI